MPRRGRAPRRLVGPAAVAVAATLPVVLSAVPASAHTTDPRFVAILDSTPGLPPDVHVAVVPGIANQFVVTTSAPRPVVVYGTTGDPLVRITPRGVFGNFATPDWYVDNDPEGTTPPPAGVHAGSAPRWRLVAHGHTFSWFDPRLYPAGPVPSSLISRTQPTYAGSFQITLRVGPRRAAATGHVEFEPVVGGYLDAATDVPAGLSVQVLQGKLPGLFVTARPGHTVDVDVPHKGTVHLAHGRSMSWLDARLQGPAQPPADPETAAVVGHWAVPVTVDGRPSRIAGVIRWVPGSTPPRATGDHRGGHPVAYIAAGAAGAAALGLVLVFGWRRGRQPKPGAPGPRGAERVPVVTGSSTPWGGRQ